VSLVAATGLGVKGVTVGGINIAGIAFGTLLALVLNLVLSLGKTEDRQDVKTG
jgi:xanthine/uracil permease